MLLKVCYVISDKQKYISLVVVVVVVVVARYLASYKITGENLPFLFLHSSGYIFATTA